MIEQFWAFRTKNKNAPENKIKVTFRDSETPGSYTFYNYDGAVTESSRKSPRRKEKKSQKRKNDGKFNNVLLIDLSNSYFRREHPVFIMLSFPLLF